MMTNEEKDKLIELIGEQISVLERAQLDYEWSFLVRKQELEDEGWKRLLEAGAGYVEIQNLLLEISKCNQEKLAMEIAEMEKNNG